MNPGEKRHSIEVKIKRMPLQFGEPLPLPAYQTAQSAGMDVCAKYSHTLHPGQRLRIATGFAYEIPPGFEIQVRPRSGLAFNSGITVLNSPGTIDSDWRGELAVILINHSNEEFKVNHGDRIAQIVIAPVMRADLVEVDELSETARGAGGFGSTGK
jgi:dUTP pyrophosphatase